jgi:hypothetical protein
MRRILLFIFVFMIVVGAGLIAREKPEYPAAIIPNPPREANSIPAQLSDDRYRNSFPMTDPNHLFWLTSPLVHAKFFPMTDPTGFTTLTCSHSLCLACANTVGGSNVTTAKSNLAEH